MDLLVRMALALRGGTRRDLAARLGRDASNVIGASGLPKIDVARALARSLRWSLDEVAAFVLGDARSSVAEAERPTCRSVPLQQDLSPSDSIAQLQRDGWHGPAHALLEDLLAVAWSEEASASAEVILAAMAAGRLWSGAFGEALAILGRTGAWWPRPGDRQKSPRREVRSERDRSVVALVIEALAAAELALRGVVEPSRAEEAALCAQGRCTPAVLAAAAPHLALAGLRPHRLVATLDGVGAGLAAQRLDAPLEPLLARCQAALGSTTEDALVRAVHEAIMAVRRACAAGRQRDGKGGVTRPGTGAIEGRIAAIAPALLASIEVLDEWPLRRTWFELERLRREATIGRDGAAAPWILRALDLRLLAGLVARYPREAGWVHEVLDAARLTADQVAGTRPASRDRSAGRFRDEPRPASSVRSATPLEPRWTGASGSRFPRP